MTRPCLAASGGRCRRSCCWSSYANYCLLFVLNLLRFRVCLLRFEFALWSNSTYLARRLR
jgi:hypothetical protein